MHLFNLPTESDINNLIVKKYEFIDYLDARFDPYMVYENTKALDQVVKLVKLKFKEAGWEGDGELKLIWLPCFLDISNDSFFGDFIWHVKQNNNGTSFLAMSKKIKSNRLDEQNCDNINNKNINNKNININIIINNKNIIFGHIEKFKKQLESNMSLLTELTSLKKDNLITDIFYSNNLILIQGKIVSDLNHFIDELYFEYLIHVIRDKNIFELKLNKIKTTFDLRAITNDGDLLFDEDNFITLSTITSSIYKDFKFLNFKDRFKEIIKSVDFTCEPTVSKFINKQIILRNCIQHHQNRIDVKAIKDYSSTRIEINQDDDTIKDYKVNDYIEFTKKEIILFIDNLKTFLRDYSNHVDSKMRVLSKDKK